MTIKIDYPFLKDELALKEIRKHKWIESEKLGQEIGFATAAMDWIQKYGDAFRKFRLTQQNNEMIFSERRNFRRFTYRWPVYLKIKNQIIASSTDNINLMGLSCTLPYHVDEDTSAEITVHFPWKESSTANASLKFHSQVKRSVPKEDVKNSCPQVFLPFNDEIRDFLKSNAQAFLV